MMLSHIPRDLFPCANAFPLPDWSRNIDFYVKDGICPRDHTQAEVHRTEVSLQQTVTPRCRTELSSESFIIPAHYMAFNEDIVIIYIPGTEKILFLPNN